MPYLLGVLLALCACLTAAPPAYAWEYGNYRLSIKDIAVASTTEATDDTHLLLSGYVVDGGQVVEELYERDPFGELEFDVDTPGQDVRRNLNLFDIKLAPGQTCYFCLQMVEDDSGDINEWMSTGLAAAAVVAGACFGVPVDPETAKAGAESIAGAANYLNSNEYFGAICGSIYYDTSGATLKMWADNRAYKGGETGAQGGWTGSGWQFNMKDGGAHYEIAFDLGDLGKSKN